MNNKELDRIFEKGRQQGQVEEHVRIVQGMRAMMKDSRMTETFLRLLIGEPEYLEDSEQSMLKVPTPSSCTTCRLCYKGHCYGTVTSQAIDTKHLARESKPYWCPLSEYREDNWVYIKDRLPDKEGSYIVSTKNKGVTMTHYYPKHKQFSSCLNNHIIAWQPKPSPAKLRNEE